LWLGTNKGLVRLNPDTADIRSYTVEDGLQSNEFNTRASFQDSEGKMYIGGVNGVNAFYPDRLIQNSFPPKVQITSVQVMAKDYSKFYTGMENPTLETYYPDNYLRIGFSALDFTNPTQNSYKYRIKGLQDTFLDLGTNHSINLELPPGDYLLEVAASNNDGIWSAENAMLRIIVHPEFWQTPLFIVSLAGLVILIVAGSVLLHLRNGKLRQIQLSKEVDLKTRELAAANRELESFNYMVSHDLQSPLMNMGHYIQLLWESQSPEKQEENTQIFNRITFLSRRMKGLIRDLLYFSRSGSSSIKSEECNLYILCLESVDELREETGFQIQFTGNSNTIVYGDCELLKIAIKNIMQNSVKFAPEKENIQLDFSLEIENDVQVYRLSDNGKIIADDLREDIFKPFYRGDDQHAVEGTGIGLAIVRRIFERHGGKVWIENSSSGGTTIAFTMPKNS
jgi:signal transduction histidine kinase